MLTRKIVFVILACFYQTAWCSVTNHSNAERIKSQAMETDTSKKIKPMVADVGMADPHIHIYNNKAYLYATRDGDIKAKDFVMPDWKIWSSTDLINWKLDATIDPASTYMGKSDNCWAPDVAFKNGKYYFYFSNANKNTGVLVADKPVGPFKDVLKKPLLPEDLTPIKEYDPTILMEDDAAKTSYIAFGHYRAADPAYYFMIAKLGDDMVSLAEAPRKIDINGTAPGLGGNDKPTLHKRNGIYYLSAGTSYATADNVYGPFKRRGFSGNREEYGLNNAAHGNYFDWNNQSFHTWCHFHLGKDVARYRQSYVNYLHYKDNGDMVDDLDYLDKHGEIGIGQYDTKWDKIEAEWYMAAAHILKHDQSKTGGFVVSPSKSGAYLRYPNVKNLRSKSRISFNVASLKPGRIEVRAGSASGKLLGTCEIENTMGLNNYKDFDCNIKSVDGVQDLYLVFKVEGNKSLNLDYFKFN